MRLSSLVAQLPFIMFIYLRKTKTNEIWIFGVPPRTDTEGRMISEQVHNQS